MRKVAIPLNDPSEEQPVPIASDAMMLSVGIADGRAIPLLILDTTQRPDIETMVRAHEHLGSGDVTCMWSSAGLLKRDHLKLVLVFQHPHPCVVIIDFRLVKYGGLVDQIVQNEVLYIQPGRPGDRLMNTMDNPRIMIEVPSASFRERWNQILAASMFRDWKKRGMPRREIKRRLPEFIAEWRQLSAQRIGTG